MPTELDPAALIAEVERVGAEFVALLHRIGGTTPTPMSERFGDRHLALANTHIEDAVSRAIRSLQGRARPPAPRIEHPDSPPAGVTVPVLVVPKPVEINVMGGVALVPGVPVVDGGATFTPMTIVFKPNGPGQDET